MEVTRMSLFPVNRGEAQGLGASIMVGILVLLILMKLAIVLLWIFVGLLSLGVLYLLFKSPKRLLFLVGGFLAFLAGGSLLAYGVSPLAGSGTPAALKALGILFGGILGVFLGAAVPLYSLMEAFFPKRRHDDHYEEG